MARDTPAARLIGNAFAFARSAKLLLADCPDPQPWGVCFVNISFAIELGLKSYLRAHGWSEAQQVKLRHDLVAAFDAAVAHGFRPGHPAERTMAQVLSPYHQDMSLRYLTGEGEGVVLLPLAETIEATRFLLARLYQQGVGMADDVQEQRLE